MTMTDRAIEELQRAGFFGKDSDYEGMLGESVKELLLVFQKQGKSATEFFKKSNHLFHDRNRFNHCDR